MDSESVSVENAQTLWAGRPAHALHFIYSQVADVVVQARGR